MQKKQEYFINENKEINKILKKINIAHDDLKFADLNFKYYVGDKFIIKLKYFL